MKLGGIRFKLLLPVTVLVAVSLGAVAWLGRVGARRGFRDYVRTVETERTVDAPVVVPEDFEALADTLREASRSGALDGTAAAAFASLAPQEDRPWEALLVADRRVLASTRPEFASAEVRVALDGALELEVTRALATGEREVTALGWSGPSRRIGDGALLFLLSGEAGVEDVRLVTSSPEATFLGALDRWLLIGVALVGAGAFAGVLALTGRLLGPVERLTAAVRGMARGEPGQRVGPSGTDELGELARAFDTMAAGLERTEELRKNLLSDVAHELRTPLTRLRARLEAIQDGLVANDDASLGELHEEVCQLAFLVDDLQELAQAEAGRLRFEPEDVDVREELERAVGALGRGEGPEVACDAPEGLTAFTDRRRFRQCLANLLENARRHTPSEGRVVLEARRVEGEVEVTVSDTGEGIAEEHVPFVFERFYRTDPSRQRGTGGVGLGLAIVKQLVEGQGGRVWVRSRMGQGVRVGMRLRASESADGSGE